MQFYTLYFNSLCHPQVIATRQAQLSAASEDKIADMEVKTMMEVMGRFRQLSPDGTECGCLKAIVLFKPGQLLQNGCQDQKGAP